MLSSRGSGVGVEEDGVIEVVSLVGVSVVGVGVASVVVSVVVGLVVGADVDVIVAGW